MTKSSGLERLLAGETNVSDLLAFFTENAPEKWEGLTRVEPVEVLRERGARTRKRADLILRDGAGNVIGAVEVKLGHHLDASQVEWYESAFASDVPLILASLDGTDAAITGLGSRWVHVALTDLVERWVSSTDSEIAVFASAVHRVLLQWSRTIAAVSSDRRDQEAEPLANVRDPFLARILTRSLRSTIVADGVETAYAGTTTGGGNPVLQAWEQLPGAPERHRAIAEVRWSLDSGVMDFRFGLDFGTSDRTTRMAVWECAGRMDDVIRVDRFLEHLAHDDPDRASLVNATTASGRPAAKGDWTEILERGFRSGDAAFFNPGFRRDGDTRLEAVARVDTTHATGCDVIALLKHALRYLTIASERC